MATHSVIRALAYVLCSAAIGSAQDSFSDRTASGGIAPANLVASTTVAATLAQPETPLFETIGPETKEHRNTGFLDFNLYPYSEAEGDNSLTINALANLPYGFQYFSLTNFGHAVGRNELEEVDDILTEQNLRWNLPDTSPLAIAAQTLIRSSDGNDVLRFGPRWSFHDTRGVDRLLESCNMKYWVAFYGAQFDHAAGYQWQIEHVFLWKVFPELLDDRVYVGGFADHNINHADGTQSVWVEEAQLGIRMFGEFYFVAEQRYNGFRQGDESSLGIGLEYVVRFK